MDLELLPRAVSAAAVQVVSCVCEIAFTRQLAELSPAYADPSETRPPPAKLGLELVRNLVLATVIAVLVSELALTDLAVGSLLGLGLWVGFPVVLWTGAVMWEKVPVRLAVIHAGDWLLKLLIIAVILTLWN